MIVRTEGLVLRTHKMGETSLVMVVFTKAWGKVRLAAKGARRPKSKFGAACQPITLGSYVFYRKEGRDLQTASEGDITYTFDVIKADYVRLGYGSAVCDLLDQMTIEVNGTGHIVLNDEVLDTDAESREVPLLLDRLRTYAESARLTDSEPLVIIAANDAAKGQRFIDVLNALADPDVDITNVTITGFTDE
mgnify:CR=1 FL=1